MQGHLRLAWLSVFEAARAPGPVAWCASDRPILLLPGFVSSPRTLAPMERSLRRHLGRPTLRVDLGGGWRDIRDSACEMYELLDGQLHRSGVRRLDVVAHSMGGLVAAYLLKCVDHGRHIRRLVTLGTPHRGVPLARLPGPAWLCPSVRQMRPGSAFLRHLARLPLPDGCELVSIAGGRDTLVPPDAARVAEQPGQETRLVAAADHCDLLLCPEARAAVRRALLRGVATEPSLGQGPIRRSAPAPVARPARLAAARSHAQRGGSSERSSTA